MISFSSKQSKGYTSSQSTHPSNILLRSSSVSYDSVLKFTNFCFDSFPKQFIARCYLHLWWYFLFRKLVPKSKLWNMSSVMFFSTIECRFSIIWFSGRAYFAAERIGVSVVAIDLDKPIQGLHWWLLAVTWQPNVALPIWCSLFETLWPSTDWRLNYITLEFFIKASMDHKRSTKATILWFTSPGDKLNKLKPFLINSFGFFFCDTLYNVYGPGPLVPALAALASSSSVITEFRWYEKQTFFRWLLHHSLVSKEIF